MGRRGGTNGEEELGGARVSEFFFFWVGGGTVYENEVLGG